jgi:hypothetical protein
LVRIPLKKTKSRAGRFKITLQSLVVRFNLIVRRDVNIDQFHQPLAAGLSLDPFATRLLSRSAEGYNHP